MQRSQLLIELNAIHEEKERAQAIAGSSHILKAEPCVHEHQPVSGFEQKTVTHQSRGQAFAPAIEQRSADRTHTSAIKVMKAHFLRMGQQGFGSENETPTL